MLLHQTCRDASRLEDFDVSRHLDSRQQKKKRVFLVFTASAKNLISFAQTFFNELQIFR